MSCRSGGGTEDEVLVPPNQPEDLVQVDTLQRRDAVVVARLNWTVSVEVPHGPSQYRTGPAQMASRERPSALTGSVNPWWRSAGIGSGATRRARECQQRTPDGLAMGGSHQFGLHPPNRDQGAA